ncbi:hypothetical protein ACJMK2_021832 [Sinanodonta woodiana]|uniref:Nuclease-associated modular DNA-binding 1 domain-containing protein n=1 Tax=Sinanodonta woodiana TaxID=1069815 RepID=A0ABD3TH91_SINWO
MGFGSHLDLPDRLNWVDRSVDYYRPPSPVRPPIPNFQYDKTRELSKLGCDINTICLNITKKTIIEFNSISETAEYFNIHRRCCDFLDYFQDLSGDIWIKIRGDSWDREKHHWFDNPETLFDNAASFYSTRKNYKLQPQFRADKTLKNYFRCPCCSAGDLNVIGLNVTKKCIVEFNSSFDLAQHFNIYQRFKLDLRKIKSYFVDNLGDIWIILRGDIDEQQREWFDNPETLFDNAVNALPRKHFIAVKEKLAENKK